MRRWLVAVLLCILVVSAVFAYMVIPPSPPPNSSFAKVNVGIFYYVWYGAPDSDRKVMVLQMVLWSGTVRLNSARVCLLSSM